MAPRRKSRLSNRHFSVMPEETDQTMEKKPVAVSRIRLKILGIGGAGGHTVTQIAASRSQSGALLNDVGLVAINTDVQSLDEIAGAEKLQVGAAVTHGLGAGGEPEIGMRAAQSDAEKIAGLCRNTDVVFLATGLGGGTGTGAGPVVARLAKEQGALVLAFVTLPFSFEGERRRQQALSGLEQLKAHADAVICIPNDKIFKIVGDDASVVAAFKRADENVILGVQSVWQLLSRKGLINLDFADLRATLGAKHCDGLFSYGEASGPNRVRDAVKNLLENPLLDGGDVLAKAEGLLVSVLGGPDLTLADVQKAVDPITRHASRAHVIMGAAIDEAYRGKLAVTVIAAANILPRRVVPQPASTKPMTFPRPGDAALDRGVVGRVPPRGAEPTPAEVSGPTKPVKTAAANTEGAAVPKLSSKPKQETLPLEGVSRGRFDKSEPTLHNGEDLDVPTFIRRGVSVKR
jgi:cell division protein FtsZ